MDRYRFYYKLCTVANGKLFLHMQRKIEVKLGILVTQDLKDPSPYLYVYRTPEQAVSSEVHYTSRDQASKNSQKTVVKIKCYGNSIESTRKWAFSQMIPVENIGMVKENISVLRATSKMRNTKLGNQRREISPRGVKGGKLSSPGRIYASVVARKASPVYKNSLNFFKENSNVKELLRKMQEDTAKIENDFRDLEKFNDFLKFEELDTDRSLKSQVQI